MSTLKVIPFPVKKLINWLRNSHGKIELEDRCQPLVG